MSVGLVPKKPVAPRKGSAFASSRLLCAENRTAEIDLVVTGKGRELLVDHIPKHAPRSHRVDRNVLLPWLARCLHLPEGGDSL